MLNDYWGLRPKELRAVRAVENLLTNYINTDRESGWVCQLITWDARTIQGEGTRRAPLTGLRIAEVSFTYGNGGSTFMQVDGPEGMAVCFQAERCVIARLEAWPEEEIREEDWRLILYALGKKALKRFETDHPIEGEEERG